MLALVYPPGGHKKNPLFRLGERMAGARAGGAL